MLSRCLPAMAALLVLLPFTFAQNPNPAPPLSPTARLTAAKTAFLRSAEGSEIPFSVISDGIQGWGHFQIVDKPEKADIIIEVTSPSTGNGVGVSSTTSTDPHSGLPIQAATSTRELQVTRITLIVYDAKSKIALWSATEQPKSAVRGKKRQDNIVAAGQHLVRKLRERIESATNP